MYSIGYRMLHRRDLAEDLAQDVFLQLYRKLESIESLEHLGFWLRRVAANLAIDWLRRAPYSATQPLDTRRTRTRSARPSVIRSRPVSE